MTAQSELDKVLGARRRAAERTLEDAVRIDLARYLDTEVEARLLARPHFRGRFPAQALVQLRRDLDALTGELAPAALERLRDLRVWFGAEPAEQSDEAAAVAEALAALDSAAEEVLRTYGFPGDDYPDEPGEAAPLDLDASYSLEYRPSTNLIWAWRRLRALDTVRNELEDTAGRPLVPRTFELEFHLPEALEPETRRPPTID